MKYRLHHLFFFTIFPIIFDFFCGSIPFFEFLKFFNKNFKNFFASAQRCSLLLFRFLLISAVSMSDQIIKLNQFGSQNRLDQLSLTELRQSHLVITQIFKSLKN